MTAAPHFFVYDGRCGLCVAFKDWLLERTPAGAFEAIVFGDPRLDTILPGKSAAQILESAHVVTPAGEVLSGHRAIALAISAGRWGRFLRPLLSLSFLDPFMRFTYTWVSKNRYRLSCDMRDRSS